MFYKNTYFFTPQAAEGQRYKKACKFSGLQAFCELTQLLDAYQEVRWVKQELKESLFQKTSRACYQSYSRNFPAGSLSDGRYPAGVPGDFEGQLPSFLELSNWTK
jgi:hypothetical protein